MSTMSARRRGGAAVLGLLLLGGGLAAAAPPTPIQTAQGQVEVEITERTQGKTDTSMKFLVEITDRMPSQIHALAGQAHYHLKLALQTLAPAQVLFCELDVHGGPREADFKTSSLVRRGSRVTVGRVVRPDGSRLEVLATVR